MSAIKKFAGQTAIYGITSIIGRSLSFLLTPLYVAIYPTKVYGVFTTMFSWASVFNAILAFGMETTYFRYLSKYDHDKQKVYNNTFFTVAAICAAFLVLGAIFFRDIVYWIQDGAANNSDYQAYVAYFIFILTADALAVIPFARLRAEGKALRYSFIKLTNIAVFVGLNLMFIFLVPKMISGDLPGGSLVQSWYRGNWVGYVFLSNLIASLLTLVLLLPDLLRITFRYDMTMLKDMLLYSLPVFIANISFIINEVVDKLFLGLLLPPEIASSEVGIYGACSKIAIFLSIFINAFRLGAEPFFFSHSKNKNAGYTYARIMNYFIIAVCLIVVMLVTNIELFKYFVSGEGDQRIQYWSGLPVVPLLLFGYLSLGIYINLSVWYKLSDQTRYGLYISGIGAVLTVVLNLIFIPQYSYMASAWISLTAYATMMTLSYYWGQKNYPIPYNVRKGLGYILASAAVVYVSFVVFDRNLIAGNTLFVIFTLVTLYLERKDILHIIRGKNI